MSSIFHERRRTQRLTDWPAYREQRAHLADLFPAIAYSGQAKRPLALGIKYDLIGANTGLSVRDVKNFLRAYTFGPKYLRMLKRGARRYALDGAAEGWVTDEEAAHAALQMRTHYEMRRAGVAVVYPLNAPQPVMEAAGCGFRCGETESGCLGYCGGVQEAA